MPNTMWVPPEVHRIELEIARHTGRAPQVERVNDRRYRLTHSNRRVHMTLDLKMTGPGRWKWAQSVLHVDGQRVPVMPTPEAYYRLFNEPDSGGREKVKLPPLEPYPLEDAPPEDQLFLRACLARFAADKRTSQLKVTVGRVDGSTALQIFDPAKQVTLLLALTGDGLGVLSSDRDGFDATGDLGDELNHALSLLGHERGVPKPMEYGSPGARRQHEAARLTSVEVRRQSVIRV